MNQHYVKVEKKPAAAAPAAPAAEEKPTRPKVKKSAA